MADEPLEIQPADPRTRSRVLIFLAVAIVVGIFAITEIDDWLHRSRQDAVTRPDAAIEDAAEFLRLMAAMISLSLAALAFVVARFSFRVLRSERLPPPGSHVIVDTPVVVGAPARRRAYIGFAVAVFLAASGVVLPYLLWRTLYILHPGPGPG